MNVRSIVAEASTQAQPLTWRHPESWMSFVSAQLRPRMKRDGRRRLRPGRQRDICWDDEAWLDLVQDVVACDLDGFLQELGEELRGAVLRTYHGTRTKDAGVFFREGLRVHDRMALTDRLKAIMAGLPGASDATIERGIAEIENEHDVGRLHVVVDERPLLRDAAHYLIYGSEWMLAVSDGPARRRLKAYGTPTLLEINLPLSRLSAPDRKEFARVMVSEWARLTCNRTEWTAPIDFTFCLNADIPPACIVGHSHPTDLRDPIEGYRPYRTKESTCLHCAAEPAVREAAGGADADDRVG